jgi:uncharacterized protein
VALLNAKDPHHAACRDAFQRLREPLVTTWPVLTEAFYLLDFSARAQDALWEMLARRAFSIEPLDEVHDRMRELMRKYSDLPMDLADASVVAVAERRRLERVFTIDVTDFGIYRPKHRKRFKLLPD